MKRMTKNMIAGLAIAAAAGLGVFAATGPDARAVADDAEQIAQELLEEIARYEEKHAAMEPPDRQDSEAQAVWSAREQLYTVTRVKLIGDLWRAAPQTPELADLMAYRWQNANRIWGLNIEDEIEAFAEHHSDEQSTIRAGWYAVAERTMREAFNEPDRAIDAAEQYIERYPDDPDGANLLTMAAQMIRDEEKREAIQQRIVEEYPESPAARRAEGERRRMEAVGEKFEFSFTDIVTGDEISMNDLRGQVVVIDFWATWCGPCLTKMPEMKRLYEEHHESGLEIIGISLDEDVETVLNFLDDEMELPWLHACEDGAGWDTPIARDWGISGIPTIFVVDREGRLHSTNARGELDEMIPELLAREVVDDA